MTTAYIDINTAIENSNLADITYRTKISEFNQNIKHIIEWSKEGSISKLHRKYIMETIMKLCNINIQNSFSLHLMAKKYTKEQILYILEHYTSRPYARFYRPIYIHDDSFISNIITKLNLYYDLFKMVMFSNATSGVNTHVYYNKYFLADLYEPHTINRAIRRVLEDNEITLFSEDEQGYYNSYLRDTIYTQLRAKLPDFDNIIEVYNKYLYQSKNKLDFSFYKDLASIVFNSIKAEYGIVSSSEGVITDIEEYVDNYIDTEILKNHVVKWV
jgi:hypothetical protein